MANITDPDAIAYSRDIRAFADLMESAAATADKLINKWNSRFGEGGVPLIPNTADVIEDGAPSGGYLSMTGADATNIVSLASDVLAFVNAGRTTVITRAGGNGRSVI
jgi:hypothetical protein